MQTSSTRTPRLLFITLLVLVSVTLLGGTLQAISPGAAGAAAGHLQGDLTPTPEPSMIATAEEEPQAVPGDTTGMAIMGVLLAVIVLFGAFWGSRVTRSSASHTRREAEEVEPRI